VANQAERTTARIFRTRMGFPDETKKRALRITARS
jgi:hypothetical protein